jgi:hypothetical protein
MPNFRKKPVVIEAEQFDGKYPYGALLLMCLDRGKQSDGESPQYHEDTQTLTIPTLEGDHTASSGDWIIKGIKGELYPCKPDIFEATYSLAGMYKKGKFENLIVDASQKWVIGSGVCPHSCIIAIDHLLFDL